MVGGGCGAASDRVLSGHRDGHQAKDDNGLCSVIRLKRVEDSEAGDPDLRPPTPVLFPLLLATGVAESG